MRRRPRVRVEAVQSGGGQERGMRSGTVPTPLVVGLGAACQLAVEEIEVCSPSLIGPAFCQTTVYCPFVFDVRLSFLVVHILC